MTTFKHTDSHRTHTNITCSMYKNRANTHVLNRMLEFGKNKLQQWCDVDSVKLINKKKQVLKQLTQPVVDPISQFTIEHSLKRQLNTIDTLLKYGNIKRQKKKWSQHTQQLQSSQGKLGDTFKQNVGRLIIANRLLCRDTEIFYNDQNTCSKCHCLYTFDHVTHMNVCTSCGISERVLFVMEDQSQDLLVGKNPVAVIEKSKNNNTSKKSTSVYHRSPLYKRYLQQFSSTAPPIPLEIMKTLYQYLSNIHLQNSVRCRPTPVATVLRSSGFSKWSNSSVIISKMFNGEPVPKMSDDLINRLVHRFVIIFRAANLTETSDKQKIPSFEFLTHILLHIEGEQRLAKSFKTHKTRSILLKTFHQFTVLLDIVKRSPENDVEWLNLPDF
jgi:hypothetical protein